MPGKLGLPEILVILAIALLIFGPSKLADLGKIFRKYDGRWYM